MFEQFKDINRILINIPFKGKVIFEKSSSPDCVGVFSFGTKGESFEVSQEHYAFNNRVWNTLEIISHKELSFTPVIKVFVPNDIYLDLNLQGEGCCLQHDSYRCSIQFRCVDVFASEDSYFELANIKGDIEGDLSIRLKSNAMGTVENIQSSLTARLFDNTSCYLKNVNDSDYGEISIETQDFSYLFLSGRGGGIKTEMRDKSEIENYFHEKCGFHKVFRT